jgi:hypothetical protein
MPTSSYPPELMEWMLQAGDGKTIEVRTPNRAAAISMRSQVHNLRLAMRKEGHPRLPSAERAIFRIKPVDPEDLSGEWLVIASQKGAEYIEALHKAGIAISEPKARETHITPLEDFRGSNEEESDASDASDASKA